MADQIQGKEIIIRCAKCGRHLFNMVGNIEELKKSFPIKLKCYACNAMNLIRVEDGYIRVDVIDK
jgi:phage FluMu protein Com